MYGKYKLMHETNHKTSVISCPSVTTTIGIHWWFHIKLAIIGAKCERLCTVSSAEASTDSSVLQNLASNG